MVKILPPFSKGLTNHIEYILREYDNGTVMDLVFVFRDDELPYRDEVLSEYGLVFVEYREHAIKKFKKVVARRITNG